MGTPGFANSSRVRCAIYSRDTAIRSYSVPRFIRNKPFVKIPSWDKVMRLAEYFCQPFHRGGPHRRNRCKSAIGVWRGARLSINLTRKSASI